jgi:hypothetical protein
MTQLEIPNRELFRQPEVCALASIQPYVLRSWEAEFPDLGVAKTAGGPRVYRRADVERVLSPENFVSTVYTKLGIDPGKIVYAKNGRPAHLVSDATPIQELL